MSERERQIAAVRFARREACADVVAELTAALAQAEARAARYEKGLKFVLRASYLETAVTAARVALREAALADAPGDRGEGRDA